MAAVARLTALFAEIDELLGQFEKPRLKVEYLRHRLAQNQRCKDYLQEYAAGRIRNRRPPPYDATDLSAIEDGLNARLAAAKRAAAPADHREAA